jgi:hypothetical protein
MHDPAGSDKIECDVEITPEMIEAGIDCFYDLPELLGPSKEQLEKALSRAFCRMLLVRKGQRFGDRTPEPGAP